MREYQGTWKQVPFLFAKSPYEDNFSFLRSSFKTSCFAILRERGGIVSQNDAKLTLTKEEEKLIEIIRKIDFGEARVVVTDGKPTRIEEIKKSIKLQETKNETDQKTGGFLVTETCYHQDSTSAVFLVIKRPFLFAK